MEDSKMPLKCDEYKLIDGELIYKFTIPSSPATKKNSNRIIRNKGFMKVIPSERFMKYQTFCKSFLEPLRKDKNLYPIDCGISVKIRVATDKWIVPDYTNVCQALGDILQHFGVIENDKWIHWTDGDSKNNIPEEHWFLGVDKENPRMEIEIRRFRHPLENYYNAKKKPSTKKKRKEK
jgi:Holliday junction resolvase RusA-like endonuclease